MRRVALVYNPASGQGFNHGRSVIGNVLAVFRGAGIDAEALATTAPGSAAALVEEAVRRGCETVLACGGDGTVNEVMQTLVGGATALGVIPLGTANALAADLGLPIDPVKAAKILLSATPVRIPVGRIFYRDRGGIECSRYFTVAAGIGADAHLMYRLDAKLKRQFGYALYAVEGLRVLATHTFPVFDAEFVEPGRKKRRVEVVSQLLAVRIRNFGGMIHDLAPGATLHNDSLRLLAFKTRSRFDFVRFLAAVLFRRQTFNGKIELLDSVSVTCRAHKGAKQGAEPEVLVEADGDMLGGLPARIELVPDALTLLVPASAQS
jgi:diacylglycerol kinase (ATP)